MRACLSFWATLPAVALMVACASQPIGTDAAQPVPAERMFAHPDVSTTSSVRVVVKRNISFAMGGCAVRVFLNGKPLADVQLGEKVTFAVAPARHMLAAEPRGLLCVGGVHEVTMTAAEGDSRAYMIDVTPTNQFIFQETAF